MLPYYISVSIDDDFGMNRQNYWSNASSSRSILPGILRYNITTFHSNYHGMISSPDAIIDINILKDKNFFKPFDAIVSQEIKLNDMTQEDFERIMSKFGNFEKRSSASAFAFAADRNLIFELDNPYDLELAYIDKKTNGSTRICLRYINSPVSSFYMIDDGNTIRVLLDIFTKDYYVITDYQWMEFVEYLKTDMDLGEQRDIKLSQILGEKPSINTNIVRQLKFIVKKCRNKSNRFLDSVYEYYEKNGFITEKQAKCIAESIW